MTQGVVSDRSDPPTTTSLPSPRHPKCPLSKTPHPHFHPPIPRFVFSPLGPLVTAGCPSHVASRSRIRIIIHSGKALPLSKRCDPFPLKRKRGKRKWNWSRGREWAPHPGRLPTGVDQYREPTQGEGPKLTSGAFLSKQHISKKIPLICIHFSSSEPPSCFVRTLNTES